MARYQSLDQLNLSGVIEVVRRNPGNQLDVAHRRPSRLLVQPGNPFAPLHLGEHALEELKIADPLADRRVRRGSS